jgi:hypothetical protein
MSELGQAGAVAKYILDWLVKEYGADIASDLVAHIQPLQLVEMWKRRNQKKPAGGGLLLLLLLALAMKGSR